jgi:hypothetical protein
MVAAKVRDGGGPPSEVYMKCLEEVQTISCATLFSPVSRQEAVQAMSQYIHEGTSRLVLITYISPRFWMVRQWLAQRWSRRTDGYGALYVYDILVLIDTS